MGYVFHFDADNPKGEPNYANTAWRALFPEIATLPLEKCTNILGGDIVHPGFGRAMMDWMSPLSPSLKRELPSDRDSLLGKRNVFVAVVNGGDPDWAKAIDRALQACPIYLGCRPLGSNTPVTKAALSTLSKRFWVAKKEAAIYGMDDEDHHDPEMEKLLADSGFTFARYSTTPPWP